MDSGKTATAGYLARSPKRIGRKVAFIKLTGTVYTKDIDFCKDCGADWVSDFSELGFSPGFCCRRDCRWLVSARDQPSSPQQAFSIDSPRGPFLLHRQFGRDERRPVFDRGRPAAGGDLRDLHPEPASDRGGESVRTFEGGRSNGLLWPSGRNAPSKPRLKMSDDARCAASDGFWLFGSA